MSSTGIDGLHIMKGALIAKCTEEKPCGLKDDNSDEFPCCSCCLLHIDKDEWVHNNHICTTKECLPDNIVREDETGNGLARRTQHYGYIYNYKKAGTLTKTKSLDSNLTVKTLAEMVSANFPDEKVHQCIINEYTVGQGITSHTDNKVFGPVIMTITLTGNCVMKMKAYKQPEKDFNLCPGDIVLMRGEARKMYQHSIKNITSNDVDPDDPRRVSVTFRSVPK